MKKRFIFMMWFVGVLCTIILSGCGSSTENSTETAEEQMSLSNSDYSFFETKNSEEYLKFLNEIDNSSTHEIVTISNSTYAYRSNGPFNVYTVTYKACEGTKYTNAKYEYSLFETNDQQEYLSFLRILSNEYEIVDISIGTFCIQYAGPFESFIVTYRKPL